MSSSHSDQRCCPILELRQYSLHPDKRDVLIDLFDREFIESQEAFGMKIIGQFRDLDDPNRFVWLRGFPDMVSRARALQSFYGGPVWKAHRATANETMIDSDNVLLLRPVRRGEGFPFSAADRPPPGSVRLADAVFTATIYNLSAPVDEGFVLFFEQALRPRLEGAGASTVACLVTERSANTFPALPVREGENVFIWFARFASIAAHESFVAALDQSPRWREEVSQGLQDHLTDKPQVLRLSPTARSQLTG